MNLGFEGLKAEVTAVFILMQTCCHEIVWN